jgi:hypothetical protein
VEGHICDIQNYRGLLQKYREQTLLTITQPINPRLNRSGPLMKTRTVGEKLKVQGSICKQTDLNERVYIGGRIWL